MPSMLIPTARCTSFDQYIDEVASVSNRYAHMRTRESELLASSRLTSLVIDGYCGVCQKPAAFEIDSKRRLSDVNWRESIVCPSCRLNNRQRLALHFLNYMGLIRADERIYVTEQLSSTYVALKQRYEDVTGSEYLRDGTKAGKSNIEGIRHEDITKLSFEDEAFDCICTFDVLEHVPDYPAALAELVRCLQRGTGLLVITAPFDVNSKNTSIRARVDDAGNITHLEPPEYHGDPLAGEGILCYQIFGWDLLGLLRDLGMDDAAVFFFWSDELGYLGWPQLLIAGHRLANDRTSENDA